MIAPVLGLSTCPRPGVDYVTDTIASLERAGATALDRFVACDGPPLRSFAGWQSMVSPDRVGSIASLHWICQLASRHWPGADLIFAEDDIECCTNAITALGRLSVPIDCGLVTAFNFGDRYRADGTRVQAFDPRGWDPRAKRWNRRESQACGLFRLPLTDFVSTLLCRIPSTLVAAIAARDGSAPPPRHHFGGRDRALAGWLIDLGYTAYGLIVPSLCEHRGRVSSIDKPAIHRRSANWSDDHDALVTLQEMLTGDH